jgi:hypothetical protein
MDNTQDDALANNKELELFNNLETAIGETLETVCKMQERVRSELITVLGLVSSEKTVKILRPGPDGDQIQESELDISQDSLDDHDDLRVVAVKKRKRSLSGERSDERKRKASVDLIIPKVTKLTSLTTSVVMVSFSVIPSFLRPLPPVCVC